MLKWGPSGRAIRHPKSDGLGQHTFLSTENAVLARILSIPDVKSKYFVSYNFQVTLPAALTIFDSASLS